MECGTNAVEERVMFNKQRNNNENPVLSWIITVVMLGVAWPIGLFLLFRMLTVGSITSPKKRQAHVYAPNTVYDTEARPVSNQRPAAKRASAKSAIDPKWGRGLRIAGGIVTALFGFLLANFAMELISYASYGFEIYAYEIRQLLYYLGGTGAGAVLLCCGLGRKKKAGRYLRYRSLIGRKDSVSIESLAKAMPVPYRRACDDLQDMLERGFLPAGYLDLEQQRLILSKDGLREEAPKPKPEPKPAEDDVLAQIKAVNDDIDDEVMSRKIDRIGEITAKILDYQRQHPDSQAELRSFLNYYLPTTLKILRSYAQMEEQGIEGENITSTKARIEGMMDKVVEGFEKRLDKLFSADAVDITSDVQVLEQMLQKDGLAGDQMKIEL